MNNLIRTTEHKCKKSCERQWISNYCNKLCHKQLHNLMIWKSKSFFSHSFFCSLTQLWAWFQAAGWPQVSFPSSLREQLSHGSSLEQNRQANCEFTFSFLLTFPWLRQVTHDEESTAPKGKEVCCPTVGKAGSEFVLMLRLSHGAAGCPFKVPGDATRFLERKKKKMMSKSSLGRVFKWNNSPAIP